MGAMTPRQRLLTAIRHREPDRVPISPRIHAWMMERYGSATWLDYMKIQAEFGMDPLVTLGLSLPNYIHDPFAGSYLELAGVSVDMEVQNRGDHSLVRRRFRTPAGELTDTIVVAKPGHSFGINPTPERREFLVKGPDDVEKIRFLLPDPAEAKATNWTEITGVIGERGLVQVSPHAGLDLLLCDSMGIANAMTAYYTEREMLDRLLNLYLRFLQTSTIICLEEGAQVIYGSWYNFSLSAGWSPAIWREVFKPLIRANVELVHSHGALYHYYDDGKVMPILQDLGEIGVDILSTLCPPPMGDVDLGTAKQIIGQRICLNGNIDLIYVIKLGTPEQIHEAVRQAIKQAAPGGGFILGTSDSIRDGTPYENVRAYFDAAFEFGCYPVDL